MKAIEAEVHKLIECGFIREEQHQDWVANIIPILKKNGKIWVCVTTTIFCPKDEFPLPITDIMIDNTYDFKRMSFMYGFSWYNQIKIYPEDENHNLFLDIVGVVLLYCYALWVKECWSSLPTCNEHNFP